MAVVVGLLVDSQLPERRIWQEVGFQEAPVGAERQHNNRPEAALICALILRTNRTRIRTERKRRKRTEMKV